ncbi:MAG: TonB-dependent receptor [Ignavibacteriae bacterium]|nr:TonB-dependent receptor [Ignavibacteriota bacterium]
MTVIRRLCLILALAAASYSDVCAQSAPSGSASGTVRNKATGRALEFVNVAVLARGDSAVVTGTVTEKNGAFRVTGLGPGDYLCRFSMIGYGTAYSKPFRIGSGKDEEKLGVVMLEETAVTLDEVVVSRERLAQNNEIDRKVYTVGQDVAASAGSASDVLQNIPSVEVDIEGNVSLRGSSNVLILVNGKNSPLMGRSSATVLQQMPAGALERIEVITNPSAKYKPDGTAGIINIVLKKDADLGLNGSVTANVGNQDRVNANLRLNYKPDGLNLYGGYAIRRDARNRISVDTREQGPVSSSPGTYREDAKTSARPLSHTASLGLESDLGDGYSAGMSGEFFRHDVTRFDHTTKVWRDAAGTYTSESARDRIDDEYEIEYSGNTFFEREFGDEHTLRAELSTSGASEEEDSRSINSFVFPVADPTRDNTRNHIDENTTRLSLDYSRPFEDGSKFETGYEGNFSSTRSDFRVSLFDALSQRFTPDTAHSHIFEYREGLHAVYATYQSSIGALGMLGGIRAEQAYTHADLVTLGAVTPGEYFRLYPSLHLSYRLGELSEVQVNYSKRTNRPDGDDLNPFPEYSDPKTRWAGNPKLLPEYVHSIEGGLKYESELFSFIPSLYYRYTYNRFTWVTHVLPDSTFFSTRENLDSDESAGLEGILTASADGIFSATLSGNVFHNRIDATSLGFGADKATVSWRGTLTCNVHVTASTMLQANARYNSARLTPQGENAATYVVNLGLRQQFLDGRLTAVLTAGDIFRSMKRETWFDTPELRQTVRVTRDSRVVYLGLTWNFGTPPKRKDDALKYDDAM